MIKAVLFDLDETLLVRKAAIRAFIEDQYQRHSAGLAGVERARYVTRFLGLEDEGRVPKVTVYPQLAAELGLDAAIAAELLADYQAVYPRFVVLTPGARETLTALRTQGLKLGIVTNGNSVVQNGKIDATGLRPLLDVVLVSETEGMSKPDPAVFALAMRRLDVAAADAVFVGDNPAVDVEGAANAGLNAVWFHSSTEWPTDLSPARYSITAMDQLIDVIGTLNAA
ncbi:hypothetical protein WH87_16970 [Devosia epidermidihirudinis]|uniref:HAD family hydrolase n=1 Tax=Devosia epidermidihirudinis TaxID=1293439 RepID=A0A0F5Q3S0_9HYPH|nr:HAD family hydrolase [Devosia epidermidihirudinis]KKC35281.1 hypothetical protein WH87_16970 [Devosia epidermidihirudinis]